MDWLLLGCFLVYAITDLVGDWRTGRQIDALERHVEDLEEDVDELLEEYARAVLPTPQCSPLPTCCTPPPHGWLCSRPAGHDGPCAAWPVAHDDPPRHSE